MLLRKLTELEICEIYHNFLTQDFPKQEQKPLSLIIDLLKKDAYFAYGFYDNDKLIAYMFFCKNGNFTLLDYFAVLKSYRCHGYGNKCINQLFQEAPDLGTLLLEVEDDSYSNNKIDEVNRKRRIHFYISAGLSMTAIQVNLFGVRMLIMCSKDSTTGYTEQQLRSGLVKIYQTMFTKEQLQTHITIY